MGRNCIGVWIHSAFHFRDIVDIVEEDQIDKQIADMEVGGEYSNPSTPKLVNMASL